MKKDSYQGIAFSDAVDAANGAPALAAAAEAGFSFALELARLKACPDTKHFLEVH